MKSLRITFLCLVLLSVGASLLNYHREHRHDDDTYLQELEHRLQCAEGVDYEDPFFGYAMRRPSCFLPAEAEGEGNVRFVYVEELPLPQVQYMTLEVRRSNVRAQTLYQSLGFEYVGVRKRYYEDNGEDAFLYCCQRMPAPDPDFEEAETVRETDMADE